MVKFFDRFFCCQCIHSFGAESASVAIICSLAAAERALSRVQHTDVGDSAVAGPSGAEITFASGARWWQQFSVMMIPVTVSSGGRCAFPIEVFSFRRGTEEVIQMMGSGKW